MFTVSLLSLWVAFKVALGGTSKEEFTFSTCKMQEAFIIFLSNIYSLPLRCFFYEKNTYKLSPMDRLLHHQKMVILEKVGKVSKNLGISSSSIVIFQDSLPSCIWE